MYNITVTQYVATKYIFVCLLSSFETVEGSFETHNGLEVYLVYKALLLVSNTNFNQNWPEIKDIL